VSGGNGSSGKCSIPEFRRSPFPMPELACLELALLNLLRQLDSTNSDRRVVESFESEHWPNPLFHPTVILFDEIVQVLARSHSHSARKFAGLLHFSHCAMRRRIAVQRDLGGCAPVDHRIAEKGLGSVHIAASAQEEIHCMSGLVHGPIQVHPPAPNLYICLVHPPGSTNRTGISTPALLEFGQVMLDHRRIVVCVSVMPRSAIMITKSLRLNLKLVYQLTQRMMIWPSKCRPLNSASIGPKGRILPSSAIGSVYTRTPSGRLQLCNVHSQEADRLGRLQADARESKTSR